MGSVLQPWVMELALREQGTLLTCVRGCDDEPKQWAMILHPSGEWISGGVAYSPARRLTAYIRWCILVPADPREIDSEEGAFMRSEPPPKFKPSALGHLPLHWYTHVMHALEIIGYRHPVMKVAGEAEKLYEKMVDGLHLNVESKAQMTKRLNEDRIAAGTVVS